MGSKRGTSFRRILTPALSPEEKGSILAALDNLVGAIVVVAALTFAQNCLK